MRASLSCRPTMARRAVGDRHGDGGRLHRDGCRPGARDRRRGAGVPLFGGRRPRGADPGQREGGTCAVGRASQVQLRLDCRAEGHRPQLCECDRRGGEHHANARCRRGRPRPRRRSLFHSYGFDLGVLPTLYAGSTLALEDVFVPRRTLAALTDRRLPCSSACPPRPRLPCATRLDAPFDLSGVQWLLSCTAPLAPGVVTAFIDRFGVPICQHYGSSETGAVTTHVRPRFIGGRSPWGGRWPAFE